MPDLSLHERAGQLIDRALEEAAEAPGLTGLCTELTKIRLALHRPMRVAVVGRIKAGKSSMVNALLREEVVATAKQELTYNVNILRHGPVPGLRVHFKDDRQSSDLEFAQLDRLANRSDENRETLNNIGYLEVFWPNELLHRFDLVDTPGLDSAFVEDSDNTRRWLQLDAGELDRVSEQEARGADAVLYLFRHSVAGHEDEIMRQFHGDGLEHASPVNAIGVLTRIDESWRLGGDDPIEAGRQVAECLAAESRLQRTFFTVLPVASKLGLGAHRLQPETFAALQDLARLPRQEIDTLLSDARRLLHDGAGGERRRLFDELGLYGIWLACESINGGGNLPEVRDTLVRASGIDDLHRLITDHFGARAALIKVATAVRRGSTACTHHLKLVAGAQATIARRIRQDLEAIETEEPAFRQLRVLWDYYDGNVRLTPTEEQHLKQITGEGGRSLANRLGLELDFDRLLDVAEERAQERSTYWRRRAARGGGNGEAIAARELASAYDDLLGEVIDVRASIDGASGAS